jgi:hypothetical protein
MIDLPTAAEPVNSRRESVDRRPTLKGQTSSLKRGAEIDVIPEAGTDATIKRRA